MYRAANRGRTPPWALPALAASFTLLLGLSLAHAADVPRAGFTRPGDPSDRLLDGKVVTALDDPRARKSGFGGTVYFLVLEKGGAAGDRWGVGLEGFDGRFRSGVDFSGSASPELDTSAKYLYLYQVVNDRRTPAPVESASVALLAELKDITSWGYFQGVGFATPAAEGAGKRGPIRPLSISNVAGGETERLYRRKAPAVAAPIPFRLVRVPTVRPEKGPGVDDKPKVANVLWDPLDPAHDPNFVMLLSESDFEGRPSFRALWTGKNVIPKGGRSTVFGFTSNLPPTLETVRLRGQRLDAKGNPIRPAVAGDGLPAEARAVQVSADGRVPTPNSESSPSGPPLGPTFPPLPNPVPSPAAGPAPARAGGAAAFAGVAPVGGLGTAAAPFAGGGGSGPGGGSGTTSGQVANSGQAQSSQQPAQAQTLAFAPVLANQNQNQQSQQQGQGQQQQQQQAQQQQQQGCPCEAVPEPATLLLATLGLPLLFFLRKRRRPSSSLRAGV